MRGRKNARRAAAVFAFALGVGMAASVGAAPLQVGYLTAEIEPPVATSNPDEPPTEEGLAGARLAHKDNQAGGKFLGQSFDLLAKTLAPGEDPAPALAALRAEGARLIVVDLPGDAAGRLARLPQAADALLINAGSTEDSLRGALCAPNLLHAAPSRMMLADALGQFLVKKRWSKWLLVVGQAREDEAFAAAIRRAAKRFGAEIVEEKRWTADSDLNRTAEQEIPTFTQAKRHDVLVVADEASAFGEYLPYRTWEPRPVAGTQGLVPTVWRWTHEQWGASQLQSRFKAAAGRPMTARDHAVWLAVRAIGEAAAQAKSDAPDQVIAHLRGPSFVTSAFRGAPISVRPWDGQFRQPILLAADRSIVSVAPQEGFLHPKTELDSLGADQPESLCKR